MDIDGAFMAASRLLFGREIGHLNEFEPYLREASVGRGVRSAFSGKDLWTASTEYCPKARFFDFQAEQGLLHASPLRLDDIKDLDSLLGAIGEKFIYGGNKTLGNSSLVEGSDNVTDSHCVLGSSMIVDSKYVAHSYLMRKNEYTFGSTSSGESSFIMRCFYNNTLKRCFECCTCVGSSDCYFCYNVMNSMDCLFSFNVRNARHQVANVQLGKDAYLELKKKLVWEMVEELKSRKRMGASILDLLDS
ncbi:MAG: hypothetical protein ACP5NX_01140 [Candidatus Bilamarchaeaceae archaeon]